MALIFGRNQLIKYQQNQHNEQGWYIFSRRLFFPERDTSKVDLRRIRNLDKKLDFVQSLAIYMKKSNQIYGEEKTGGNFTFLSPQGAYKRADLTSAVAMLQCRGKKADLMLST